MLTKRDKPTALGRTTRLMGAAALAALGLTTVQSDARAEETFKIGVITFLSGQAAESFGVPAWDGGKLLIEAMNAGELPEPYDTPGMGGMQVEAVVLDEAGGASKQVQEFRNLSQREQVDAVVGYVSSSDCLAVPPVADELKQFTILYDCGTPRVFEEASYEYVFRTAAHAVMDNVALARYLVSRDIQIDSYAGINQDYAWGQDSWRDFAASMEALVPDAEQKAELFPKFGAGQYGTEVSALLREQPDVVHSSLWGGDLQSLVLQAKPRGLFERTQAAFSAADHVLPTLGEEMPDGVILGARGANGQFAYDTPLNRWFWDAYIEAYDRWPPQAPYRMIQALLGLKTAVEKAMAANGGSKPTDEELVEAMTGLEWQAPSGTIKMALGDGHQAIQDTAIGRTKWNADKGIVELVDIERYDAECVNPPPGIQGVEWIKQGFPGAKCD